MLPWQLLSHFASAVCDDQQEERRANATPANTRDVTLWGIRTREECAADRIPAVVEGKCSVTTPLLSMPIPDFAYWLGKFVLKVRKKDASVYPTKTLYRMVCCFKRFFEQNKVYSVNPLSSNTPEFGEFRQNINRRGNEAVHSCGLG